MVYPTDTVLAMINVAPDFKQLSQKTLSALVDPLYDVIDETKHLFDVDNSEIYFDESRIVVKLVLGSSINYAKIARFFEEIISAAKSILGRNFFSFEFQSCVFNDLAFDDQ